MKIKDSNNANKSHMFNVQDAIDHGIEKAAIIYNFCFWLDHNRANNKNLHDGYYWTYNTAEALAELMPYISSSKMARLLRELHKDGIILVANYNKKGYDRTKWYSMPCYASLFKNEQCNFQITTMDSSDLNNASSKFEQTIPNINTDINQIVNTDINTVDIKNKKVTSKKAVTKKPDFDPKTYPIPFFVDSELWVAYHDMRNTKKRPALATKYACKLIVENLTKFNEKGLDANQSLENSIRNSWIDVFEPKPNNLAITNNKGINNHGQPQRANQADAIAQSLREQLKQQSHDMRTVS